MFHVGGYNVQLNLVIDTSLDRQNDCLPFTKIQHWRRTPISVKGTSPDQEFW